MPNTPETPETFKEGSTQLGSFSPKNYVVAVLPDAASARAATEELGRHSYAADEVKAWRHDEIFRKEDSFTDDRNIIQKVDALFSDEEKWMDEYRDAINEGNVLITVYAPEAEQPAEVRDVLSQFGATKMRHYGAMIIEDLIPGDAPG